MELGGPLARLKACLFDMSAKSTYREQNECPLSKRSRASSGLRTRPARSLLPKKFARWFLSSTLQAQSSASLRFLTCAFKRIRTIQQESNMTP